TALGECGVQRAQAREVARRRLPWGPFNHHSAAAALHLEARSIRPKGAQSSGPFADEICNRGLQCIGIDRPECTCREVERKLRGTLCETTAPTHENPGRRRRAICEVEDAPVWSCEHRSSDGPAVH